MGVYYINEPEFLIDDFENAKLRKLMFIKKGGKAVSKTGYDLSRDCYDVELICISDENDDNWIGNYAEGLGFCGVQFAKEDCREATEEEIQMCKCGKMEKIKF